MKALAACLVLGAASAGPLLADVAAGIELSELRRSVSVAGSSTDDTEPYESLSGFVGFDWGNSMFYVSHRNEDSSFAGGRLGYGKKETSFDWHWNEQAQKSSFTNLSVGLFRSTYEIDPFAVEEFWGAAVGFGTTKMIHGEHAFFVASGKVKLPYTDDERFLEADDESRIFVGFEGKIGLGVAFGQGRFSVQAGYRAQEIDFDDVFVDDSSEGPYVGARVFLGD